jgi:hypothetical protein
MVDGMTYLFKRKELKNSIVQIQKGSSKINI